MEQLIQALQILSKYTDSKFPTHCEHDELYVNVHAAIVSEEDIDTLNELGFKVDEFGTFKSYKYGSC